MATSRLLFLALLAAIGATRLYELRRSSRNVEGLKEIGGRDTGRRLYAIMVTLHVLLFVLPPLEVVALDRPFPPVMGWVATALVALGTFIRWHAITTLGGTWTTSAVVSENQPVCDRGLYRWIRHPNYLGVLIEVAALPLVHGAWISATALGLGNAVIVGVRIGQEEGALFRIPGYREKMGPKKRLVPGVI